MLVLLAALAGCASEGPAAQEFPVPRAESEFQALRAFVLGAGWEGPLSAADFLALAGPYAPLDLGVTKAADPDEASLLRNYYLGATARGTGVEVGVVAGLANAFHCGSPCTDTRRESALEHMRALKDLAALLQRTKSVRLVARWGQPGSFRVNDAFKLGNLVREAVPSATMGFIPSGTWKDYPDIKTFFATRGIPESSASLLLEALENAQALAAVRVSENVVQVVLSGIGDNQAGLMFQPPRHSIPKVGTKLEDGTELKVVQQLEPGVIYYETT